MNKSDHQSPPLPPISHQTNDPPHRSITKPTEPVTKPTTTITDQIRERKRYSGLEREKERNSEIEQRKIQTQTSKRSGLAVCGGINFIQDPYHEGSQYEGKTLS